MNGLLPIPKVLLHDHLDGGLRPATVLALAAETGYEGLPFGEVALLADWFDQSASDSLVGYLAAFDQTVAVMQTPAALHRVACETVEDLASDGVVYAEIRFAPSLHLQRGMSRREVIEAVLAGLAEGERATGMAARVIVDAMRHEVDSLEVAEAAAEFAGKGVVGFDLAGPEAGHPASSHRPALELAREAGLHLTIHAGEADGPASIADAMDCGAERLGHGVRVVEDVAFREGEIVDLGPIARRVHREGMPLEVCPSSNVHTGAVRSMGEHPAAALLDAGFAVTLNTDNRLMSRTSMTREFEIGRDEMGMSVEDLHTVTRLAVEAAFCDETTRSAIAQRVDAGYEAA